MYTTVELQCAGIDLFSVIYISVAVVCRYCFTQFNVDYSEAAVKCGYCSTQYIVHYSGAAMCRYCSTQCVAPSLSPGACLLPSLLHGLAPLALDILGSGLVSL